MKSVFKSKNYFEKKNIFSSTDKEEIQKNIVEFANLFRQKINRNWKKKKLLNSNDLNEFLIFLEKYNKDYIWNLQQLICFLPVIKKIQTNFKLIDIASDILNIKKDKILIQDPLILINLPSITRNLYSWHNACNYYQKRNNFLGMWIPLIEDKNAKNGSMIIAEKSHIRKITLFRISKRYTLFSSTFNTSKPLSKFKKKKYI